MRYYALYVPMASRRTIVDLSDLSGLIIGYGWSNPIEGSEVVRSREGVITLPLPKNPITNSGTPPTHIIVTEDGGPAYPRLIYHVTRAELVHTDTVVSGTIWRWRLDVSLCGVWSLRMLAYQNLVSRQVWELSRTSDQDHATPEPVDCLDVEEYARYTWNNYDPVPEGGHYYLPEGGLAISYLDPPTNATYTNTPQIYSYMLCDTNGDIMPTSDAVTAFLSWAKNTASEAELKRIYRVQIIPKLLFGASDQFNSNFVAMPFGFARSINTTGRRKVISGFNSHYPQITTDEYEKAAGKPTLVIKARGTELIRCSATYNNIAGDVVVYGGLVPGAGVSAYIVVTVNTHEVAVASFPLFDVPAIKDGLSQWWDGAKANVITGTASSIISIVAAAATTAATKGAAAPTLAGAIGSFIGQSASTIYQASLASDNVRTIGVGSGNLYGIAQAMAPLFEGYLIGHTQDAVDMRNNYFINHGTATTRLYRTVPPTFRPDADYIEGRVDAAIYPTAHPLHVTQTDIVAAANEELSAGVTIVH